MSTQEYSVQSKHVMGSFVRAQGPIGQSGQWYVDLHPVVVWAPLLPILAIAVLFFSVASGRPLPADAGLVSSGGLTAVLWWLPFWLALILNHLLGVIALGRAIFSRRVGVVELSGLLAMLLMLLLYRLYN